MPPRLLSADTQLGFNVDGMFQEHTQAIPSEFLDTLKDERSAKTNIMAGDYERVCSVPTFVVELWLRQGFDYYRESARACIKRLRDQGLEHFITTPKRV
jgi:hypothetical protein